MASIYLQQQHIDSDPVVSSMYVSALGRGAQTDAYDDAQGVAWVRYYGISNEALDSNLATEIQAGVTLGMYLQSIGDSWQHDPIYDGYFLEVSDTSTIAYPEVDDGEGNMLTWAQIAERPDVSPIVRDGRTFFGAGSSVGTGSRLTVEQYQNCPYPLIAQHALPPADEVAQ